MAKLQKKLGQLTFDDARKPVGHGGWRPGAGRKKGRTTPGHITRSDFSSRAPVHVTLRCVAGLPSLRRMGLVSRLRDLIARSHGDDFRIIEFSVMDNHIHLVIECAGCGPLARAMHLFAIRAARIVKTWFVRTGRVFAERYHARPLCSPREVRNALAYVLNNARHHAIEAGAVVGKTWFDPFSSAPWFDGWSTALSRDAHRERAILDAPDPCAPARTWLLAVGWKRHGMLELDAIPGPQRVLGVPRVVWNDDLPAHRCERGDESSEPAQNQAMHDGARESMHHRNDWVAEGSAVCNPRPTVRVLQSNRGLCTASGRSDPK